MEEKKSTLVKAGDYNNRLYRVSKRTCRFRSHHYRHISGYADYRRDFGV